MNVFVTQLFFTDREKKTKCILGGKIYQFKNTEYIFLVGWIR